MYKPKLLFNNPTNEIQTTIKNLNSLIKILTKFVLMKIFDISNFIKSML